MTKINIKRIAVTVVLFCGAGSVFPDTVYQNFFNNAYDGGSSGIRWRYEPPDVGLSSSIGVAASFSVPVGMSYRLDSVTLPLAHYSGAINLEIALFSNNGNSPEAVLETLTTDPPGIANTPNLYTFTSSLFPLLDAGNIYWLVLQPHDRNVTDQTSNGSYDWNSTFFGLGPVGMRDYDFVTNDWAPWIVRNDQQLPAFRIEGTAVPEPATCALFGFGAVFFWFLRRRRTN